jgi:serine/threonine protein kinase
VAERKLQAGQKFGEFTLQGDQLLGKGGNGVVWAAVSGNGTPAVVKFLMSGLFESGRYKRFVGEIDCLKRLGAREGVVPLLGSYLPEVPKPSDRPWLAMVRAVPLCEALTDPGLEDVVGVIQQLASVLGGLHEDGIAHRDIKPDNLFILQGKPAIGDFGLAYYPEKEAITQSSEIVGPYLYVAPEMLERREGASPYPADVYSLAKTLFVLGSGQRYPLPGEFRVDTPQACLSSYSKHPRAGKLEMLLQRSTRMDPNARPSMRAFADELMKWREVPVTHELPQLAEIGERLSRIAKEVEAAGQSLQRRNDEWNSFLKRVIEMVEQINDHIVSSSGVNVARTPGPENMRVLLGTTSRPFATGLDQQSTNPNLFVRFNSGAGADADRTRVRLAGANVVSVRDLHGSMLWQKVLGRAEAGFELGSASADHALAEIESKLRATLSEALGIAVDAIERPSNIPTGAERFAQVPNRL